MVPRAVGAVLVPCHAAEHGGGCWSCCQCILLPAAALHSSPATPWGEEVESCQGWRRWGCHLPRASSPASHLGLLAAGMHRSTRCSRCLGRWLRILAPSLTKPSFHREENLHGGGRHGRGGRDWQPPGPPSATQDASTAPLLVWAAVWALWLLWLLFWGKLAPSQPKPGHWEKPPPAPWREGTLPPVRGTGTSGQPPAPLPAPHPPLSSHPDSMHRGMPSGAGQVYASTTHLEGQTDRNSPSPWCPPSARRQLLPPARGHRRWDFVHK